MNPTEPNHEPARDQPWQFSLKSLVLTLTGCSVLFGLIAAGALPVVLALFALAGATLAAAMLLVYLFNHPRVAAVCVSGVTLLFLASMLPSGVRQSRRALVQLAKPQPVGTVNLYRENLRQIAAALNAYQDEHGHLPPAYTVDLAGNRLHSWRTLILPHLGRDDLFQEIRLDEPWDSPLNRRFHQSVVILYASPSNSSHQPNTNYVAVTGPGTAWPGSKSISLDQIDDESNTILVMELADSDIHWMEPRDLDIERVPLDIGRSDGQGMSSRHRAEINVLYADGIVDGLPEWMQPDDLRPLFTITRDDDTFR